MEAVVALGVAGNKVQFLDFATKLCVTSIEIYRDASGASTTNAQSEILLKSFIDTIEDVSNDLGKYFNALNAASAQANVQGDVQIRLVIADCQAIAQDLSQRFEKLKASGKPGKWKSFVAGLKCVWGKNELDELQKRLKKNRDDLEWRIMLSLRY
jgi:capsule polysaccharide export protein KpsE/RkpR